MSLFGVKSIFVFTIVVSALLIPLMLASATSVVAQQDDLVYSPADMDQDNDVDVFDYARVLGSIGMDSCGDRADIDGDCDVDPVDMDWLSFYLPSEQACHQNTFKAAFVIVGLDGSDITPERLTIIETLKENFAEHFYVATSGLATMDTSYPVAQLVDDGVIINPHGVGNYLQIAQASKKFLETHPDNFDFLYFYTAFPTTQYQQHATVINRFDGIGREPMNIGSEYGTQGKLLGAVFMGSIDMYQDLHFTAYNGLLHETGHQWCCFVGDNFNKGQNGEGLEIIQQNIHWYKGLDSPYISGTAVGSDHWVSNGDGTFKRENSREVQKYHPFSLYLMGLIPSFMFDESYNLYNAGIIGEDFDENRAVFYDTVSIRDIITTEGQRSCVDE